MNLSRSRVLALLADNRDEIVHRYFALVPQWCEPKNRSWRSRHCVTF